MKRWMILFCLLAMIFSTGSGQILGMDLVCLVVDELSLDELLSNKTSNFDRLQQLGAFGLMNVRTAGHLQSESTYLSAGAGKRCQGSKKSYLGNNLEQGVINPGIEELIALNQVTEYQGQPGLLGMLARERGIIPGVLGNADTLNGLHRTITTIVMDEKGYIPRGDVSSELYRPAPQKPWGFETDWKAIKKTFQKFRDEVDILLIETGDSSRVEDYADWLTAEQRQVYKTEALTGIDDFLGYILQEIDLKETALAVIAPTPPQSAIKAGKRLSWLIIAGKEYRQGLLTSQSTRRKGIITITDILPTFLNIAGAQAGETEGFSLTYKKDYQVDYSTLQSLNNQISTVSRMRPFLIRGFIVLQLGAIILSIILLLRKKFNYREILKTILEYLLLVLLLVPINFLIITVFGPDSIWSVLIYLTGLTAVELLLLIKLVRTRLLQVLIITISLTMMISFDLCTGYYLQADSILGYSSIIGARYYGLGNEYMGFYIGGALLSLTGILELLIRKEKPIIREYLLLLPLFFLLIVYLCGAANRGANFGGMITAIFAGGSSYLYLYHNIQTDRKNNSLYFKVILGGILVLSLIIYLDYRGLLGFRSHIGRSVERVLKGDWAEIFKIISRKLSMNFKLLRWTIWTRVLLAFIIALFLLFKYPVARLRLFLNEYPALAAGFYGGITGSIITMFVNDSGVVAAATIFFFPIFGLLFLILDLNRSPG